ncbi:MAG TPA: hypothetical protein VIS96_07765 [Terrimicrobiaceae bacterium]
MGFGLYERYITSRIHKRNGDINKDRYVEASEDFERAVSPEDFERFWEMYRVGVQHYFHPKHFTKGKDKTRWGWDISENKGYKAFPRIVQKKSESDLFIITIDPWLFVQHILDRWYEHPELMDELSATALGEIQQTEAASRPALVLSAQTLSSAPDAGNAMFHQPGTGIAPRSNV